MKVCPGCGMRRITIRITGLSRNLGWDDGIKRKFGRSRLQDWAEIWVKMTGLDKPIRDLWLCRWRNFGQQTFRALRWRGVWTILHNIQGEASFRLTAFFRFTCVKGLLHNIQIPNSNHSVMKDIVHHSMWMKGFLYRWSHDSRIKTRQPWVRFVIHQSLATVVVLIVPLTIRLMKTCSTRSKRLDQYLSDYRALKDKQSVLNNCSVRTLFNFLDWRGRTD